MNASERGKSYRKKMADKGYLSTTIYLSKEHRAELKRLCKEDRLSQPEAAEHIFKVYLESENKSIKRTTHEQHTNESQNPKATAIFTDQQKRIEELEEQMKVIMGSPSSGQESAPQSPDLMPGHDAVSIDRPVKEITTPIPEPENSGGCMPDPGLTISRLEVGSVKHEQILKDFIIANCDRLDGKLSGKKLAKALDDAGIPTLGGRRWANVSTANLSLKVMQIIKEIEATREKVE